MVITNVPEIERPAGCHITLLMLVNRGASISGGPYAFVEDVAPVQDRDAAAAGDLELGGGDIGLGLGAPMRTVSISSINLTRSPANQPLLIPPRVGGPLASVAPLRDLSRTKAARIDGGLVTISLLACRRRPRWRAGSVLIGAWARGCRRLTIHHA
jgi:hypothetical protein